jgi:hypothetical protein
MFTTTFLATFVLSAILAVCAPIPCVFIQDRPAPRLPIINPCARIRLRDATGTRPVEVLPLHIFRFPTAVPTATTVPPTDTTTQALPTATQTGFDCDSLSEVEREHAFAPCGPLSLDLLKVAAEVKDLDLAPGLPLET